MDTKLGTMVIYVEELLPIELLNPLFTLYFKMTWQNLNHYISTTAMPMADHQTWQDGDFPWRSSTHKVIWPFDHVVLQVLVKKLNSLHLNCHSAYDHQT